MAATSAFERSPEVAYTRHRTLDDLWGYCRECYYAETCMAGCTATAEPLLGRPGNNPYCLHRAEQMPGDQAGGIAVTVVIDRHYDTGFKISCLQGTVNTDRQGLLRDPSLAQMANGIVRRGVSRMEGACLLKRSKCLFMPHPPRQHGHYAIDRDRKIASV